MKKVPSANEANTGGLLIRPVRSIGGVPDFRRQNGGNEVIIVGVSPIGIGQALRDGFQKAALVVAGKGYGKTRRQTGIEEQQGDGEAATLSQGVASSQSRVFGDTGRPVIAADLFEPRSKAGTAVVMQNVIESGAIVVRDGGKDDICHILEMNGGKALRRCIAHHR